VLHSGRPTIVTVGVGATGVGAETPRAAREAPATRTEAHASNTVKFEA
jgi:hypothetical protein